ncbi:SusC/RagA family TonB-linked outer membrane protein [Saccharicrinis aurantiacus]|uniref:SusC/RagA family TonB-linked outer membrane protein n=1 Tax=Saccharicrinis aurantiacus TaxID=1849719 RepID=UPI002490B7BF|nr:TonB-dependent receptor [Saccharicrinis aurantiacus]
MKMNLRLFAVMVMFCFVQIILGQNKTISGSVRDDGGQPLPGVSILIEGTTQGTISDFEGNFSLVVPDAQKSLIFSFIGFQDLVVDISNQTELDIQMVLDSEGLDEVVVVGYGTMKKKLVTGANLNVKGEKLEELSTPNAIDAMKGITPGLNIVQNSAQPGAGTKVFIRGIGTTGDAQPLYIVDGVIQSNIDYLSTSDIENIDVLKDAASAAIYGARAANGVILVTTRKGRKNMKTTVTYNGYYGVQNVRKSPDLLNAQEYALMMDEARVNSGLAPNDYASMVPNWEQIESGESKGTNWFEEARVENAAIQNHALNITGGSENSAFALGYSYFDQEGVMGKQSNSFYNRHTFRLNSEHTIINNGKRDIVKLGQNLTYSKTKNNGIRQGNQYWNDVRNFVSASPFMPVYSGDQYHYAIDWNTQEGNPIALMDYLTKYGENDNNTAVGSAYLVIEPIDNLVLRTELGVNAWWGGARSWVPKYDISQNQSEASDKVEQSVYSGNSLMWTNTATYDFTPIANHNFSVMAGQSMEATQVSYDVGATGRESLFQTYKNAYINNTTVIANASGSDDYGGNLMSYFGRFSWNYKETYLLSAMVRADGSSNFTKDNRWGVFPSVSAGWVLTNESFMEGNLDWLSFLKIRASWGQVGNHSIEPYLHSSTIGYTDGDGSSLHYNASYGFGDNKGAPGTTSSTRDIGSYPARIPNKDITWETSEQLNIGVDFHLLNSRLQGAFDWYKKDTKDWLVWTQVPSHNGISGQMINGGQVTNQGIETSLRWNDRIGSDFNYGITASYSYNENEVTDIKNSEGIINGPSNVLSESTGEMFRAEVGLPIGYFWGYETDGVIQNDAEAAAWVAPDGADNAGQPYFDDQKPGDLKFVDQNGDGKIDDEDKVNIGNPNPKHILGIQLNTEYKGIYLNITGNGAFGHQVAKSYRSFGDSPLQNYTTDVFDRWHGEGTSNTMPRLDYSIGRNQTYISDVYIQDANYFKVSNITLGYDFKRLIKDMEYFSGAKLYVTLQDFFVFTNYNGMDPEVGYGPDDYPWASGIDLGLYPAARTVLVGVSLTF